MAVSKKKITTKKTVKKITKKVSRVKVVRKKTKPKSKTKEIERRIEQIFVKDAHNPIISPSDYLWWEQKAVFNPAAVYDAGKVHLIYRAIGNTDSSVLGYINSFDGINFDLDKKQFCYTHKKETPTTPNPSSGRRGIVQNTKINYSSGGGGEGGCEDPRLTKIGNTIYMLYMAFNGWDSARMTLTSISQKNFENNNWKWKKPVFISPPGQIHKNWVLFPNKINGKYAFMHAITPKIMIDYVEDLDEFDGETFIYSIHQNSPMWSQRDKLIRGAGPTPIKTEFGWLVFYHGMDAGETHKYKLYAMLLDLDDPTKIISKSKKAILEPEEVYENSGIKPGIVYSCGAVVKDSKIFIYYGAADNVICVATADYKNFLENLRNNSGVIVYKHNKIKNDF